MLAEISRVLKPGGRGLSIFPYKGVWREAHCGLPFLHWFSKNSRPRVYYAAACRSLGLGYHKGDKSVMQWSGDFCAYLDKWTHYRTRREIDSTYSKFFCDLLNFEDYWLQQRLGTRKKYAAWLPASIQRMVATKLGCLVFSVRKPT